MNTTLIFSAFFAILFVLYLIGCKIGNALMQRLSLPLFFPCFVGVALQFLLLKMPDSFHVVVLSSIAVFFAFLSVLMEPMPFKKSHFFANLLFSVSNVFWVLLFYSIFFVYKVSVAFSVVMAVIYFFALVFLCVKFGIKSAGQISRLFFVTALSFFLNFISIATIIHSMKIHAFCLLGGTLLLLCFSFASLSTRFKTGIANSKIIITLLFVFGEMLVYASSVLLPFDL